MIGLALFCKSWSYVKAANDYGTTKDLKNNHQMWIFFYEVTLLKSYVWFEKWVLIANITDFMFLMSFEKESQFLHGPILKGA